MASLQLQPPDNFDFKKPDEWQRWKRRFEQFRSASGLSVESEERQISTLLYCLGQDAEEVLASTGIMKSTKVQSRRCLEASPLFSAQNDSTS